MAEFSSPIAVPDDIAGALERARARFPRGVVPRVVYFPSVSSSNDVAGRLAEQGAADGTAVVAEYQTAGRGRLGRVWFSPPGAGLYVSTIVRGIGYGAPFRASLMTLAAGVGFAEGLTASTHLPVEIKWPNDLMVARRKIAGILTEAGGTGDLLHAVVGVGINLRVAAYPPEIADRATSVEAELGRPAESGLVLAECLVAFARRLEQLRAREAEPVLDAWRRLSPSAHGARVEWAAPDGVRTGITAGIDADGALVVRTGDSTERIVAGEVRWV